MEKVKLELCIDSISSLQNAVGTLVDRVELCSALFEGGITPSIGVVRECKKLLRDNKSNIGLFILIRPRGGDFLYSKEEFQVMIEDIVAVKEAGANGVVIGVLLADGTVDIERTRVLVKTAYPMQVTFHRAFDMTRDPFEALEAIASIPGIQRILTSGQANTAFEGIDLLAQLHSRSQGRIIIMPGGGVTEQNAKKIASLTGTRELHCSLRKTQASGMQYRASGVFMGGALRPDEFSTSNASAARIKEMTNIIAKL